MSDLSSSFFKTENDVLIESLLKDMLNQLKAYDRGNIEILYESADDLKVEELHSKFESFDAFFDVLFDFEFNSLPLDVVNVDEQIQFFSSNLNNPKLEKYQKVMTKVEAAPQAIIVHGFALTFPIYLVVKSFHDAFFKKDDDESEKMEMENPSSQQGVVWKNSMEDNDNSQSALIYMALYWKLNSIKYRITDFLKTALTAFPELQRFPEDKRSDLLLDKIIGHYQTILQDANQKIRIFNCFKLPHSISDLFVEAILYILQDYQLEQAGELHHYVAKNENALNQAKRGSKNQTSLSRKETVMLMRLLKDKGVILDNVSNTLYADTFHKLTGFSKNTLRQDIAYSPLQLSHQTNNFDSLIELVSDILEDLKKLK